MADNSVDAIVTDPPYGLSSEPDMAEVLRHWLAGDDYQHKGAGFMGKTWDSFVPGPSVWREAMRILKPGGHLLAFFGSRTYDMGALAIRLAGFEIRDQALWIYGSGFPKSLNVAKAIESGGGRPEDIRRMTMGDNYEPSGRGRENYDHGSASAMNGAAEGWEPVTEAARQWDGWGTALKPSHEPICLARKPLAKGLTVAANVLQFGTGALNIDGCRIETADNLNGGAYAEEGGRTASGSLNASGMNAPGKTVGAGFVQPIGRWPANIIHDGSEEVVALFPAGAGQQAALKTRNSDKTRNTFGDFAGTKDANFAPHDKRGSAARFFYCAEASRKDRNEGTESLPQQVAGMVSNTSGQHITRRDDDYEAKPQGNHHPTVKPTDLMAYLCRLVTPPGGVVLDPFMGSGSTGKACMREGFRFIGIDMTPEYVEIARARIEHEHAAAVATAEAAAVLAPQLDLFGEAA
jgi:site-specific DNA-methyltransferase (adenine-specific)